MNRIAPVEKSEGALPLARIKVLDLTVARAGPTCVRHLADWGADVVRIEAPNSDAGDITGGRDGFDFQNLHRNKRSVVLDLKSPEGKEVFFALAAKADVIVENMRADVKFRLGIDYESVRKVNERVVYGSISGFGQDGPYSHRAGLDQIVQGMGGLMLITGMPGQGPVRAGIAVADLTAGNLLALGIMMALFEREQTGRGRWVYTSLLESMIFMLDFQAARWLIAGQVAGQAGNDHPTATPMGVYETADIPITIAAASQRMWEKFCDAVEKPEWKEVADWQTAAGRSRDRANLNREIAAVIRSRPSQEWVELLDRHGIPCGPIYSIDQVFADPQVKHLEVAAAVENPRLGQQRLVGTPLNMQGLPKFLRRPTPAPGEHADEVLTEAGLDRAAIEALRRKKVI